MDGSLFGAARRLRDAFGRDCKGSTAVQFAIAVLPIAGMIGVAIDYTRASRIRTDLQEGLDAAALAGAKDDTTKWKTTAINVFQANAASTGNSGETPTFQKSPQGNVTGSLSTSVPTEVAGIIGVRQINVGVRSTALVRKKPDRSCILTLGDPNDIEHDSMVFNGAPRLEFDQCTIRSNTSMRCNGHDGGSVESIASGSVHGCSNPEASALPVEDIYAPLAKDIVRVCGSGRPGGTWKPGLPPLGIPVFTKTGYVEFHICGDLTLSGSGDLTGAAPIVDTVIIVENGKLIIDDNSAISTKRVAIILTGDNSYSAEIEFPNGNGKASTFAVSPPIDPANPWRGISIYQDPSLTNVDSNWGPAATFNPDGVVYMPKADVVMSGNGASNLSGCTKLVAKTFRTNGSVDISFKQDATACANLGVRQWSELTAYLAK